MSGIKLIVHNNELEQELEQLIKGKLKNLLRSDQKIIEMIEETIQREVARRVAVTFIGWDVKNMAEDELRRRVDGIITQGKQRVATAVQDFIDPLNEKSNIEIIERIFNNTP